VRDRDAVDVVAREQLARATRERKPVRDRQVPREDLEATVAIDGAEAISASGDSAGRE
jgi:hypothetical protein